MPPCATSSRSWRHDRMAPAGHPLRHCGRSGRRAAQRRRARRATDLDGCEGRRLGGHAAHRQAGRNQCALVQRLAHHERVRDGSWREPDSFSARRRPPSEALRASCAQTARACTTSSRARTARMTASGRTRSLPSACRTARSPPPIRRSVVRGLPAPPAHLLRIALARAGKPGVPSALSRRRPGARRRLSPRAGLGVAAWTILPRRRIASAATPGRRKRCWRR